MMGQEHRVELAADRAASLHRVSRAAERWGAEWRHDGRGGGRLALPVAAGLRYGRVEGPLWVEPTDGGSRLTFRVEESTFILHKSAVLVLVLAALGALVAVAWPFVPALAALLPLGFVLVLLGWFVVIARLRNSGPEEFLADLVDEPEDPEDEDGTG